MRYLTMIKNQKNELFSSKLLKWNNRWTMDFIYQNEYMQAEKRKPTYTQLIWKVPKSKKQNC